MEECSDVLCYYKMRPVLEPTEINLLSLVQSEVEPVVTSVCRHHVVA